MALVQPGVIESGRSGSLVARKALIVPDKSPASFHVIRDVECTDIGLIACLAGASRNQFACTSLRTPLRRCGEGRDARRRTSGA